MRSIRSFSIILVSPLYPGVAIRRSRISLSKFAEHHVPQVIQAFSQLYRIDQGPAASVIAVQTVKVRPGDQKRGDLSAACPDPHACQAATAGKQIRASEQVRHFKGAFQKDITSFLR
jgi:hypothetical protein